MAPINGSDSGWLASLARQSTSADNTTKSNKTQKRKRKGGGGGAANDNKGQADGGDATITPPLTKAQRIERREQKRNEREERRRVTEEARQNRLAKKRQNSKRPHPTDSIRATQSSSLEGTTKKHRHEKSEINGIMTTLSKRALTQLSSDLDTTVSSHVPKYLPKETTNNGLPAIEPKGKATKRSTLRPDSKELQPRKRDYNGQGLVRPTLFLPFDDPSYKPKLELEFGEHVPGFFGKAKQKAAKKQADENMLWKRCLKAKEGEGEGGNDGGGGKRKKKKKGVKLDDRVEDMMRKGIM